MKKLITTIVGGMPIVLDDFRFTQEAFTEAVIGLIPKDGNKPVIVSGCEYDKEYYNTSNRAITSGWVYVYGELFRFVSSGNIPNGSLLYWDVVTVYDPAGNKTFQNGVATILTK